MPIREGHTKLSHQAFQLLPVLRLGFLANVLGLFQQSPCLHRFALAFTRARRKDRQQFLFEAVRLDVRVQRILPELLQPRPRGADFFPLEPGQSVLDGDLLLQPRWPARGPRP